MEVWKGRKGREVYGARKVWLELSRQGVPVARCTVERLMRDLEIGGVRSRRKRPRTTVPGDPAGRPSDLLQRCFDAPAPNRRWVADITYVMTFSGWVYTAFVMDLFARRIVAHQAAEKSGIGADLSPVSLRSACPARASSARSARLRSAHAALLHSCEQYTCPLPPFRATGANGLPHCWQRAVACSRMSRSIRQALW